VPALGPVPWGPQGPAPLLSEEFDAFCKAMAGNAWRDDHAADARAAWKLWSELMDDCRLDEIGRKPWEFRERLSRLPKLHGKSVFKGLTAPTAITRADAIERGKFDPSKISAVLKLGAKVERLSKKDQNKHGDFFIALFNWPPVAKLGYGNPFTGTLHKKREIKRDGRRTRTNLTDEDQAKHCG